MEGEKSEWALERRAMGAEVIVGFWCGVFELCRCVCECVPSPGVTGHTNDRFAAPASFLYIRTSTPPTTTTTKQAAALAQRISGLQDAKRAWEASLLTARRDR